MNIYKISQEQNTGYDTYDAAVVYAENADQARNINPRDGFIMTNWRNDYWCSRSEDVEVEYIGESKEHTGYGVILASFNAG